MEETILIFLALVFETTPFLLAGVVISVAGGRWLESALATSAFRNPFAGIVAGTSAGLFLPMCDCGSRPLAHRLALAGRREFALAFMVAAPVVNPIVVITTWLAFRDVELLALRLGITVLMAVSVALVVSRLSGAVAVELPGSADALDAHAAHATAKFPARVIEEFLELFQYLVVGSALAALVQVFLDQDGLLSANGIYLAIAAMMFLAFLLSICSSVDAFVVAGLGGVGLGPALAFLTLGPLVNLKSVPMYLRLFSVPAILAISFICIQIAFVSAVVVELRAW